MKTPSLQLELALTRGELVTVCWEPTCPMHRLDYWGAQQWLPFEKRPAYRNYSHGVCPEHARLLQEEVEQFLFEQQLEELRHFQVEYQPAPESEMELEPIAA